MQIIKKHILSEFLRILALTLVGFVAIFMLVEFVEKVDELLKSGMPFATAAGYFIYKVPAVFSLISPIAVLLAALLSLGILSKHAEITSIKAGGINIIKVITPLLTAGIIISACIIFINEAVVPAASKKADSIERKWLKKKSSIGSFGIHGLWLKNRAGIYNIKKLDLDEAILEGITLYELREGFEAESRITAKRADWDGNVWIAEGVSRILLDGSTPREDTPTGGFVLPGLGGPEEFSSKKASHESMNFKELKRYIRELEKEGYDTTRYLVDLYGKFSFPLVNFIMVLVGVPFALRPGRRSGLAEGVAVSVLIAFSFWIIFAICRSLGQSGIIAPIAAAAFPDLLFIAIGIYLFSHIKQ